MCIRDRLWVAGGSGNLLFSSDNGENWLKDREIEEVPSNLYKVVFNSENRGFVLGERGYLLKYEPSTEAA